MHISAKWIVQVDQLLISWKKWYQLLLIIVQWHPQTRIPPLHPALPLKRQPKFSEQPHAFPLQLNLESKLPQQLLYDQHLPFSRLLHPHELSIFPLYQNWPW